MQKTTLRAMIRGCQARQGRYCISRFFGVKLPLFQCVRLPRLQTTVTIFWRCFLRGLRSSQCRSALLSLPLQSSQSDNSEAGSLGAATQQWCERSMSNLDYLLCLNRAAGRRLGDPAFHPIVPWVLDMTAPHNVRLFSAISLVPLCPLGWLDSRPKGGLRFANAKRM